MSQDAPYVKIAEHFDEGTIGAPKVGVDFSRTFIEYLKLLYKPEEAELVQHLRMMKHFTSAADVSRATGREEGDVRRILDGLLARSHIVGLEGVYALPEIALLVNIHQFRLKTEPEDLEAARLYQQFFIQDGFYKYYESSEKGTPLTRVIPVEAALEHPQKILDTEEAQSRLALVPCPCRTRTEKMGIRECRDRNPVGDCIMMGNTALHFETETSTGPSRRKTAKKRMPKGFHRLWIDLLKPDGLESPQVLAEKILAHWSNSQLGDG